MAHRQEEWGEVWLGAFVCFVAGCYWEEMFLDDQDVGVFSWRVDSNIFVNL